jgi:hypothetical protein
MKACLRDYVNNEYFNSSLPYNLDTYIGSSFCITKIENKSLDILILSFLLYTTTPRPLFYSQN